MSIFEFGNPALQKKRHADYGIGALPSSVASPQAISDLLAGLGASQMGGGGAGSLQLSDFAPVTDPGGTPPPGTGGNPDQWLDDLVGKVQPGTTFADLLNYWKHQGGGQGAQAYYDSHPELAAGGMGPVLAELLKRLGDPNAGHGPVADTAQHQAGQGAFQAPDLSAPAPAGGSLAGMVQERPPTQQVGGPSYPVGPQMQPPQGSPRDPAPPNLAVDGMPTPSEIVKPRGIKPPFGQGGPGYAPPPRMNLPFRR